jgi:nitrate/TMAO reductase-like tetraheme cytochrome c subunit
MTVALATQTLEQLLERAWQDLRAEGEAECPVCHEQMNAVGSEGVCASCGAALR